MIICHTPMLHSLLDETIKEISEKYDINEDDETVEKVITDQEVLKLVNVGQSVNDHCSEIPQLFRPINMEESEDETRKIELALSKAKGKTVTCMARKSVEE
ncbi:hypothetical protein M153_43120001447 [Pseudoloma neurophilia]|uniref:Uncharacterized protein n=1 Tax=Pseudoloma neurophilia TaxID=146866 RepID=A0A0R0LSV8_9MICR|nr:hypothetical protein M153_43120001447 [Pseudoloma neurophilia]